MQRASSGHKGSITVLFTCIGRRVSLLNAFKAAAKSLKLEASFIGTEVNELSGALQLCDKQYIVSPVRSGEYIEQLKGIIRENRVNLIVPTIDPDVRVLSANKNQLEKLGCRVLVSEREVLEICQDKRKTFKFMVKNGFGTPKTLTPSQALKNGSLRFPCFVKPYDGSASKGSAVANSREELEFYIKRVRHAIVQEFIEGSEFTCDVYVDFSMRVRCVVPRRRIEVRAGEVRTAQIVKDPAIIKTAGEVISKLCAGPGVITLQLFKDRKNELKCIEINPRFGGGVPLAIKAGANFPKWILQELTGASPRIKMDGYRDNLYMFRYDSEVWLQK